MCGSYIYSRNTVSVVGLGSLSQSALDIHLPNATSATLPVYRRRKAPAPSILNPLMQPPSPKKVSVSQAIPVSI